ncbi:MAG: hypothetical protein K2X86_01700 [Cytophagaceae bacterium]|nr:hypothetical protein [Cytophagaceae bacterium]
MRNQKFIFTEQSQPELPCVSCQCEMEDIKSFNDGMKNVSSTVKKIDTAAQKFSEGASKFAKKMEAYVDTTKYKKDSTGTWRKKR